VIVAPRVGHLVPPLLALALSGAGLGCASARPASAFARVLEAEGQRDVRDPAVLEALAGPPLAQAAALRMLARSAEPDTHALVAAHLQDDDASVATWAAFAVGQIAAPEAEAALTRVLRDERSAAPAEVAMALARVGTASAARAIAPLLAPERPLAVRERAAYALGILSRRRPLAAASDLIVPPLAALASADAASARAAGTYGLMRLSSASALAALVPRIAEPEGEIRAQVVRGLAAAGVAPGVLDGVLGDPDVRVRVEVVRALGLVGSSTKAQARAAADRLAALVERELSLPGAPSVFVLIEAVDAARRLGEVGRAVVDRLVAARPRWEAPRLPADHGARVDCALALAFDERDDAPSRVRTCGDASTPAWRRLELEARLAARRGARGVDALLALSSHADARVRAAAVDALSNVRSPAVGGVLVSLLDAEDPFVASAAAGALEGHVADPAARPVGLLEALARAIDRLAAERESTFVAPALDTLAALGADASPLREKVAALGVDPRPAVRHRARKTLAAMGLTLPAELAAAGPRRREPGPSEARRFGRVHVRVRTGRGAFEAVLFGDVAPRTVARVVELAERGFYADLRFHRVVPDFVVQGGCPRGDGSGGPGEDLLDEVTPVPFGRGALGIATAGKDTGGSQFFVTHSRQPHLEGSYTLFGQVTRGMEVVDELAVDDPLLGVDVLEAPAAD
jgi:cyclophilin family peptidyl-prolyl cis-trans isomerase/HEAT repeat protein